MLKYLVGPLLGALIGYCTNYIAVKMLFRPRHEVRVFGHRLPFTPGAIPKGKPRLARAVGSVISKYLVTPEDIESKMLTPEAESFVTDGVSRILQQEVRQGLYLIAPDEKEYDALVSKIDDVATEKIIEGIRNADVPSKIREKGKEYIRDRFSTSMLSMFLTDRVVDSIVEPLAEGFDEILDEKGEEFIRPEVSAATKQIRDSSVSDLLMDNGVSDEVIRQKVTEAYEKLVRAAVPRAVERLDIAGMIKKKIDDMEVEELERLVMQVMKRELDAIVNLGALIGFVLGLLSLVF